MKTSMSISRLNHVSLAKDPSTRTSALTPADFAACSTVFSSFSAKRFILARSTGLGVTFLRTASRTFLAFSDIYDPSSQDSGQNSLRVEYIGPLGVNSLFLSRKQAALNVPNS